MPGNMPTSPSDKVKDQEAKDGEATLPTDFQCFDDVTAENGEPKDTDQQTTSGLQNIENQEDQKKSTDESLASIPSSTPTDLIAGAPSDFEHLVRDQDVIKTVDSKVRNVRKVPSAFRKPSASLTKMFKKKPIIVTKKSPNSLKEGRGPPEEESQATEASSKRILGQQSSALNTLKETEQLPEEIACLVKEFIEKQKKTYTINGQDR